MFYFEQAESYKGNLDNWPSKQCQRSDFLEYLNLAWKPICQPNYQYLDKFQFKVIYGTSEVKEGFNTLLISAEYNIPGPNKYLMYITYYISTLVHTPRYPSTAYTSLHPTHIHTHIPTHTNTHTHTHTHTDTQTTHTHSHTHTIHTQTHTHRHIHRHTNTHTPTLYKHITPVTTAHSNVCLYVWGP